MSGQTDMVIETILNRIDEGVLNPGDSIAEDLLIAQLQISKTPLREALIRLEQMGLVIKKSRKGYEVFRPSLEEFLGILEVHAALEGQAAELAARRISSDQAVELESAVAACEAFERSNADTDARDYYQLNLRFHKTVAEAAGNPFLLELIKSNARKLMAYYRARYRYEGAIEASVKEHRQIAEMILDRKSAGAAKMMSKHVHFDQVTAMDLLAATD